MDEAIRKARVLVEALGWVRQFRGRYVVIKLGGSTLENPDLVRSFLTDVLFLETVGMRPILIHGGGKDISRAMEEAGLEPRWVSGRRYTDEATLKIAARVLTEDICQGLVDVVIGGPPCSTWSRLRYRPNGPPPVRSRDSLWGFQQLPPAAAGRGRGYIAHS